MGRPLSSYPIAYVRHYFAELVLQPDYSTFFHFVDQTTKMGTVYQIVYLTYWLMSEESAVGYGHDIPDYRPTG